VKGSSGLTGEPNDLSHAKIPPGNQSDKGPKNNADADRDTSAKKSH
jgi:hypothetical protein